MSATDERQHLAYHRYLLANPELSQDIQALSEEEQRQQVQWAFEDAAQSLGLEPWEYVLELVADSPQALATMREAVHREVAEALGMTWEQYKAVNDL